MSEAELIAKMRELLPVGERTLVWSGDDCAKIAAPEGSFLVTTDALVAGQHFRTDWSSGHEIGRRAAAQNLADIAAAGGHPSGLVVSMVIPCGLDEDWILEVVRGFGDETRKMNAGVVGGDITCGQEFTLAVTAFGYATRSVERSGARPGDKIAVAGDIGVSGVGLALLREGVVDPGLHEEAELGVWHYPVSFYRVPRVPLEAGPQAADAGASAMIDVSDGLGLDLQRIAKASKVSMRLSRARLRVFEDAHEPWLSHALDALSERAPYARWQEDTTRLFSLGEDHALLATFPPSVRIPAPFKVIGEVEEGASGAISLDGLPFEATGWDHLGS